MTFSRRGSVYREESDQSVIVFYDEEPKCVGSIIDGVPNLRLVTDWASWPKRRKRDYRLELFGGDLFLGERRLVLATFFEDAWVRGYGAWHTRRMLGLAPWRDRNAVHGNVAEALVENVHLIPKSWLELARTSSSGLLIHFFAQTFKPVRDHDDDWFWQALHIDQGGGVHRKTMEVEFPGQSSLHRVIVLERPF